MPHSADIAITNAIIVTVDSANTVIPNGTVLISGDTISQVLSDSDPTQYSAKRVIDAKQNILMPGLINTHTHAAMTLFRGLADDLPLQEWLEQHIWPAEGTLMSEEFVALGTELACAEMIRSGTTSFLDMYFFENTVGRVAKAAGMRAWISEGIIDFPTPNAASPAEGLAYTQDLMTEWKDDPLISPASAAHAIYSVDAKWITKSHAIAAEHSAPFTIHLAETQHEFDTCQEQHGISPTEYLEKLRVLDSKTIAAHCVHITDHDLKLLAKTDTQVSHDPESNMKLASGVAPMPTLLSNAVNVSLSTDGAASNNTLCLFSEMATAAKLHKVTNLDPTVCDANTIIRSATINGAKALGVEHKIGSVETGKKADLIILDTTQPHATPMYDPCSHIVYALSGHDVETTIINGQIVMENRQFKTLDWEKIRHNAGNARQKIAS